MNYIEKLNLQTEEIEEVETLENHTIINSGSVNKYNGHTREFLAIDGDYNDGFNKLKEVDGLGISCIVSKEVKEARKDSNGVIHEKLKDRIDSEVNEIKSSLDNMVSYPIISEEDKNKVIDITKEYGNILRYGAKDDGETDNSEVIQYAIDICERKKCKLIIPYGRFYLSQTLKLPNHIEIEGFSVSKDSFQINKNDSIIITNCDKLFIMKSNAGKNLYIKLTNVRFINNNTGSTSCVFYGMNIYNSKITECNFLNYGRIFGATINGTTIIRDNSFGGIREYFIKTNDISGFENVASIVDSEISSNYINGNCKNYNPTCFYMKTPSSSKISKNYIDFFKIAFYNSGGSDVSFTENIIDICFRGFAGSILGMIISNNTFTKLKKETGLTYFNLADDEMKNNPWCCLYPKYPHFKNSVISSNIVSNCDTWCDLYNAYNIGNTKVIGNVFNGVTTKYKLGMSATGGYSGLYIDDLMYSVYDTLPSPTLTDMGDRIVTFNGMIIRYKNKLIYNNNGVWTNLDGTEFKEN